MKMIYRIGKLEFRSLFYSPIAWLLLIIFSIHSAFIVSGVLSQATSDYADALTAYFLFTRNPGLFVTVEQNLYLYIPLLTMGIMSREFSSGSDKLLFSSPVRIVQLVLGKYLAVVLYWLGVLLLLLLIILACYLGVSAMDWGTIFSGLLGIFLLACAYSAIGVFMSCLTAYQVVAALSTLILLGALNYMGGMWQDIPVVRDLARFLNMSGHTGAMRAGLIVSRDLLYFILMTVLFISLAIFYLQDKMASRPPWSKLARYSLLLISVQLLGYLGSSRSLTFYYDATADKSNTISNKSQAILLQLKGPVKITAYVNLLDADVHVGMPSERNWNLAFWDKYIRFLPGIELEYVNYYDTTDNGYFFGNKLFKGKTLKEMAEHVADGRDWDIRDHMPPSEIRKRIDLSGEDNKMVRQVEYAGKKAFIREFDDIFHEPLEQEIMTAFKRMLVDAPVLAFVSGHHERSVDKKGDREYKLFAKGLTVRRSLINQGFDIRTITLERPIPDSLAALVIADPTTAFSAGELQQIGRYLDAGGNLLILTEPNRQAVIDPLLGIVGLRLMNGELLQDRKDLSQDMVFADEGKPGGPKLFMQGVAGLDYTAGSSNQGDRYTVKPVLRVGSADTWMRFCEPKLDTGRLRYDPSLGDKRVSVPVGLSLTREKGRKEQRIMVVGDADFMSSSHVKRSFEQPTNNLDFATGIFKWFSYGKYPDDFSSPDPGDPGKSPLKPVKRITEKRVTLFCSIFYGIIPGLLLLSGAMLLFSRRRK